MRGGLAVVTVALSLLAESRAAACLLDCSPSYSAPPSGATIPANAPAIFATGSSAISLATPDGTDVPFDLVDGLIRPRGLWPTAGLLLSYNGGCSAPPDAGFNTVARISIAAEAPLPTKAGTLNVTYSRGTLELRPAGGCPETVSAHIATLSLAMDAALVPFRAVTSLSTTVDGTAWGSTIPGTTASSEITVLGKPSRYPLELFAVCDGSDRIYGLKPGSHRVELTASILGGPKLPPIAGEIDLACPGDLLPIGSVAQAADAGPRADEVSDEASGCATSRAPYASWWFSVIALSFARRRVR
jgi:hypothetical protein